MCRGGRIPDPAQRAYTDATNAELFAWLHADKARYVSKWGVWITWNGACWQIDSNGAVIRLIIDTARTMRSDAGQIPDKEKSKRLYDHAIRSEASNRLAATEKIARAILPLPIVYRELNKDLWLL